MSAIDASTPVRVLRQPPQVSLGPVHCRRGRIGFDSSEGTIEVDGPLLGLLLDRALEVVLELPASELEPLAAAERVLALEQLEGASGDLITRDLADCRIAEALQYLIGCASDPEQRLEPWQLARIASALAAGVRRSRASELRAVLNVVRDTVLEALPLTPAMPLEHQTIVVAGVAATSSVERGAEALLRELAGARELVAALANQLDRAGVVDRLPSAPALRMALALADTANTLGHRTARRLSCTLCEAVRRRLLPSGAISATPGSPWPIQLSTQLLFVAVTAACGADRIGASRALGFALLHLVDELPGRILVGYDSDGRPKGSVVKLPPSLVPAVLRASAGAQLATGLRPEVRQGAARAPHERWLRLLQRLRGTPELRGASVKPALALAAGDTAVALATRNERLLRRAAREVRALSSSAPPLSSLAPSPALPLERDQAQLAILGVRLARAGYGSFEDYREATRAAVSACAAFSRPPQPDIGSTGGVAAWSLTCGLVAAVQRNAEVLDAVWAVTRAVLAAQGRDGGWPPLVLGEDRLDVNLVVIEQLLEVQRALPAQDAVLRAARRGRRALTDLPPDTSLADRVRALTLRAAIARPDEDLAHRRALRNELMDLLSAHRTPLGGLDPGPNQPGARLDVYAALAAADVAGLARFV